MMTPDEIEEEILRTEREIMALIKRVERRSGRQVGRVDYDTHAAHWFISLHMRDWRPTDDN
jgi:hypothetical protein